MKCLDQINFNFLLKHFCFIFKSGLAWISDQSYSESCRHPNHQQPCASTGRCNGCRWQHFSVILFPSIDWVIDAVKLWLLCDVSCSALWSLVLIYHSNLWPNTWMVMRMSSWVQFQPTILHWQIDSAGSSGLLGLFQGYFYKLNKQCFFSFLMHA